MCPLSFGFIFWEIFVSLLLFFIFCCCVVLKVSKATFFKYCLAVFCLWTNDFEQWAVVGRHNTRRKPTLTSCQHENWKLKAKNVARKKHEYEHKNTRKKEKIISETPQCKSWYDMENIWIQIQKDSTPIGIHRDVHMYMYCRRWYTACVCLHVSVLHLLVYIEHMYVLGYVKVLCRLAYAASRR